KKATRKTKKKAVPKKRTKKSATRKAARVTASSRGLAPADTDTVTQPTMSNFMSDLETENEGVMGAVENEGFEPLDEMMTDDLESSESEDLEDNDDHESTADLMDDQDD